MLDSESTHPLLVEAMSTLSSRSVANHRTSSCPLEYTDAFQQLFYASQIHEVVAMLFAKASTAFLIGRIISPPPKSKIALTCIILAWAIFHLFAVVFQCSLPSPWNSRPSQCRTHGRALYAAISLNALTDIILALWVVPVVWVLRMPRKHKISVIFLFGLRIWYNFRCDSYA
jgi:hypothetical protein